MTTSPMKNDDGKPRYDLLPPKALGLLVDCLTYGAKKYDDYNWRKDGGIDPNRLFAATQRHLFAWKDGEVMDKESGLPHLAHAATNLLMMLDLACRPPVKIPNFSPPSAVAAPKVEEQNETKDKPKKEQSESKKSFFSPEEQHMYRERFAEAANALKDFKGRSAAEAFLNQSEEERKLVVEKAREAAKPLRDFEDLSAAEAFGAILNQSEEERKLVMEKAREAAKPLRDFEGLSAAEAFGAILNQSEEERKLVMEKALEAANPLRDLRRFLNAKS